MIVIPRFDNEGYNPERRNDIDRTVPEDENYYGINPVDLDFNNRENNTVRRQQQVGGVNPCESTEQRPVNPVSRNKSEKNKKKNLIPKLVAIVLAVVILLGCAGAGTVVSIMNKVNYHDKKENTYVDVSQLRHDDSVKNILLLGVDARSGQSGEETRSDTMMLVTLDGKNNTIKLTSFLRDTWLFVPTLDYSQRLNAACSSGGYQGVVDAIEYNFGIDIDGYAVVDFEMFKVLVDSIGGVEVEVSEAEANEVTKHPKVYGNVVLESGKYRLTGEQALAYCRIRKIDTDFVRTQRQRTVMSAILSDAKHSNPLKLIKMAQNSAEYIETDLSKSEIKSLVMTALSCLKGEMQQEKVPFDDTWYYANIQGNSVIAINVEDNKEKLIAYLYE